MDLQKIIDSDAIILEDIVGVYTPAFMQIRLTFPFDGDFTHLERSQKGTLLHEYIHYLQNISTPFGLYESLLQYREMADMFAYMQSLPAGDVVNLPVKYSIGQRKIDEMKKFKLFNGSFCAQNLASTAIMPGEPIDWHMEKVHDYKVVILNLMLTDGSRQDIILGGWVIMESMAAMCQHLIDPDSTHEGYDIPYNVVRLFCQQYYPDLAASENKLITLCYISLFSMNPGAALIEQLKYATVNPKLSSEELFHHFVMENSIKVKDKTMSVVEFFDGMVDEFKRILTKTILCDLDYIAEALDRVKLSNSIPPLVAIFADGVMNDDKLQALTDYLGFPYMYCERRWHQYPSSLVNPGESSQDMIALIGHHALFKYLSSGDHSCPLNHMECSAKPECKQTPWHGNPCPVQVMAHALGIDSLTLK